MLVWAAVGSFVKNEHLNYVVKSHGHRAAFSFTSMMLIFAQGLDRDAGVALIFVLIGLPFFFGHVTASIVSCFREDSATDSLLALDARTTASHQPNASADGTTSADDVRPAISLQEV